MSIEQAFNKYKKDIIRAVENNTSLFWNKKSFVYIFYIKPDNELVDEIIEELVDEVIGVFDDKTEIMFDEDNVRGFIMKKNLLTFEKSKL